MKKFSAFAVALVLALTVASSASAANMTAEQITALLKAAGVSDSVIAVVVAGMTASTPSTSAPVQFNVNLGVGSQGADVSALQSILIEKGYLKIAAPTGYFGAMTKAAVSAWQAANGISATGFFGPLSRAAVNSTVATVPPTTTPNPTTPVVADGTDGSATVSVSPYVSRSQTLKKGDTKDIIAVNLKGTSGPVTVNRFDVHFNTRPWLVFSQLVLKDSTGKVIATKTLSSSADATEVTTNSDYLVRFDNVNYVVTPSSSDTILVVNATVLSSSDKITGQTIYAQVPTGSIRTVNGRGYTDSLGLGSAFDASYYNQLTLSSTGSTGDLNARIDPSTPDTRTETVSTSNTTSNVTLGVFGVKLQNQNGTINGLTVDINTNRESMGYSATTLFQNVRLMDGSTQYGATSLSTAGLAVFSNMTINMTQDQWKSLKVVADVLATSTSFLASSTLDVSTVSGVDTNYNTITLTNASDVAANNVTFVPNGGITISNIAATKGSVTTPTSGTWLAAYPSLSFTVTNNGNNPIYLSKTSNAALATTTSGGPNASSTVTSTVASGSTTGDTSTSYIVNVGASRTFTYNYTVDNTNGTTAAKKLSITQINYGTSDGDTSLAINFGLENLYVQVP